MGDLRRVRTYKHKGSWRCCTHPYYIAELVRTEKEHSDWLPERSEFSYTDR